MKIIKIGTFNKFGMPTGWEFDGNNMGNSKEYCMGLDILGPGIVDVNGIEIVEWTEKRKEMLESKPC